MALVVEVCRWDLRPCNSVDPPVYKYTQPGRRDADPRKQGRR